MTEELNVDDTSPTTTESLAEWAFALPTWFHPTDEGGWLELDAGRMKAAMSDEQEASLKTYFKDLVALELRYLTDDAPVDIDVTWDHAWQKIDDLYELIIERSPDVVLSSESDPTVQLATCEESPQVCQPGEGGVETQTDELSVTIALGGHPPPGALIDFPVNQPVIAG